jgi:hypothetical protein
VGIVSVDASFSTHHLRDAGEFLESAEDSFEAGRFKASSSSSCLSGIRSADAVCVAELGKQWSGEHSGAAGLLTQSSLGQAGAELLSSFLEAKNLTQYRTILVTEPMAQSLLDKAIELNELARAAVLRAGHPMP